MDGETFAGIFKILFTDGGKLYNVKFHGYDGDWVELKSQIVEEGTAAVPPYKVPKVTGYTFFGWTPDITNISGDMTVYAQYQPDPGFPKLPTPLEPEHECPKCPHDDGETGCRAELSFLPILLLSVFALRRKNK